NHPGGRPRAVALGELAPRRVAREGVQLLPGLGLENVDAHGTTFSPTVRDIETVFATLPRGETLMDFASLFAQPILQGRGIAQGERLHQSKRPCAYGVFSPKPCGPPWRSGNRRAWRRISSPPASIAAVLLGRPRSRRWIPGTSEAPCGP